MTRNIQERIGQMTLQEKAALCSGQDFWHTKAMDRLGIPSVMLTDGPHGLRKQRESTDHLGLYNSVPATCFPTAAGMACSWDPHLLEEVGQALGRECLEEGVAVLLGPGANIKRSPLCGRNFEYFSEDPLLSGALAAGYIRGVQSQGVGTSLKHFAANNQEHRRMSVDAQVEERTLREIYLASFERPVKEAQPWTVMCAYNRVNGTYAGEHSYLLTDVLKHEWGHKGLVVSDWGAVNQRVDALKAGLELEMPGSGGINDAKIVAAVQNGSLDEEILDDAVERILEMIFRWVDTQKQDARVDFEDHHRLARRAAGDSMVLLKNDDALLPLDPGCTVALVGGFAEHPRFQGGGSSHVNPTKLETLREEMEAGAEHSACIQYCPGFSLQTDEVDEQLIEDAVTTARRADAVVLCLGLPDHFESEGFDRTHMRIPDNQLVLLDAVSKVADNVAVVLFGGSPVEMPWHANVKAVLQAYLGGQAGGGAVADVLYGALNPSGRLAETFPVKLHDTPSFLDFPGEGDTVRYREGVFVGYRYYDTKKLRPRFAFGHGLSYTRFRFNWMSLDKVEGSDQDTFAVRIAVENVGDRAGQEVVQLYVSDVESSVQRPKKELKAFEKVSLEPGESKTVTLLLDRRAFAYYNTEIQDWHVETGKFLIMAGHASDNIVLTQSVDVHATQVLRPQFHRNSLIGDLLDSPHGQQEAREMLAAAAQAMGLSGEGRDEAQSETMMAFVRQLPLRSLISFSGGRFSEAMLENVLERVNS